VLKNPSKKYRPFPPIELKDRRWPNETLTHAPRWCSVDLRDGNQALAVPMNVSQKLELFQTLVKIGFKEIEVGFPSASNTEFAFNRLLIEKGHAPDDVWLQVLVQSREDLIERTVESLIGAKKVIIHLYNSTSPAQRRVVFGKSKDEIKAIAVNGARMIKDRLHRLKGTEVIFAGKFQHDGSGICQGDFRGRHGRVAADAATQDDFESAGHGRGRDAQCLCRSN